MWVVVKSSLSISYEGDDVLFSYLFQLIKYCLVTRGLFMKLDVRPIVYYQWSLIGFCLMHKSPSVFGTISVEQDAGFYNEILR